jgi:hypothetical protein
MSLDGAPAVPGYRIEGELGRGGMGVVYRAVELSLNRPVALKVLLAGEFASASDLARFRAEAEAAAAVQHPHVVRVYAAGQHDGLPYLALELVPGDSLAARLTAGPLQAEEAARVVEQIARGVQAAHDRGVLHRDLKPANVLFDDRGEPKVADFGLAKLGDSGLTASGAVMGTPSYMAPEQARGDGKLVGPAVDVWALGAMLYECLAGRPPFRGQSAPETLRLVSEADPEPLPRSVPRDLRTVALKCLEKDPAKRYASAGAMADDLAAWRRGDPLAARPPGLVGRAGRWMRRHPGPVYVAAGALIAAALVVAIYSSRVSPPDPTRAETGPVGGVAGTPPPLNDPDEARPKKAGAVGVIQNAANRMTSSNNVRQLLIATHNMHSTYGSLPPPAIYDAKTGQPLLSWRVAYLPFIDGESEALYKQFKLTEPWDSEHNRPLIDKMPKVYSIPNTSPPTGHTYYRTFVGPGTVYDPATLKPGGPFGKTAISFAQFTDGTANTMLIAEGPTPVPWTKPEEFEISSDGPLPALGGIFEGGFNAGIADGRIYFVSDRVSEKTLRAALTPRGHEILGNDWPYGPQIKLPTQQRK